MPDQFIIIARAVIGARAAFLQQTVKLVLIDIGLTDILVEHIVISAVRAVLTGAGHGVHLIWRCCAK